MGALSINQGFLPGNGGGTPPPVSGPPADGQKGFDAEQIDRILGSNTNTIVGALSQLLSLTGTLDAQFQNLSARSDPTIPALINSELQRFVAQQNGGGFDANAFLSGDFSTQAPSSLTTLGAGSGSPFDIPIQRPGSVNPVVQQLLDNIGAQSFDSIQGVLDFLFRVGGPNFNFEGGDQRLDPQTDVGQGGSSDDLNAVVEQILGGGGAASSPPAPLPVSGPAGVPAPPPPQLPDQGVSAGTLQTQPAQSPAEDILRQLQQPQVAQGGVSGATTPILGRFAQGGTVPQTGAFILEQGEQVIPNRPTPPGVISGSAFTLPPGTAPQPPPPVAPTVIPPGPFDLGGNPAPLPETPPPPPPPPPVDQVQGQVNPLQQAINSILGIVQGGGPLQQNINDNFANQIQSSGRAVSEDFGRRGLGGSGIEEQLQLQSQLGLQNNAVRASNDLALSGAQALGGLSLGAGQFGLQQQQLAFQQNQSLFESLLRAIQGSQANPGENPIQTVNVI